MVLIGSGALLWHAAQRGIDQPLPENSMDVDPISDSDEVVRHCYARKLGLLRNRCFDGAIARTRAQAEIPAQAQAHAVTLAKSFPEPTAQKTMVGILEDLLSSDHQLSPQEGEFLGAVKAALGTV